MQTAPFALSAPQDILPTGNFLLPVCISREGVKQLLNIIKQAQIYGDGEEEIEGYWAILEALGYTQDPTNAPCYPSEQEDTIADDILQFIDGIVSNYQEGGITKALGYVIDELGRIVIETTVRVVSTAIVGLAVASVVNILIGGVVAGTVAVGAGEIVEVIFDTGDTTSKIIEFVYERQVA